MRIEFDERGWDDYLFFFDTDRAVITRIHALLKDCARSPFAGIGKPERLRGSLAGVWSRRITEEHRQVYRVVGDVLQVAQCRWHYDK